MTVKELCEQIFVHFPNPDTKVGVAMSGIHGWVNGVARIMTDEKGRCIIDQTEETLDSEEVQLLL